MDKVKINRNRITALLYCEPGTVIFLEYDTPQQRTMAQTGNTHLVGRVKAKIAQRIINGFYHNGEPIYLIRVELIKTANPEKRGRKKKQDAKNTEGPN